MVEMNKQVATTVAYIIKLKLLYIFSNSFYLPPTTGLTIRFLIKSLLLANYHYSHDGDFLWKAEFTYKHKNQSNNE